MLNDAVKLLWNQIKCKIFYVCMPIFADVKIKKIAFFSIHFWCKLFTCYHRYRRYLSWSHSSVWYRFTRDIVYAQRYLCCTCNRWTLNSIKTLNLEDFALLKHYKCTNHVKDCGKLRTICKYCRSFLVYL